MSEELGYTPLFGCLQPDTLRFAAAPSWDEANEVLPESQWEEHDDLASFCALIEAQKNNNCTNAALANAAYCAFQAAGVENVPRFSWSFLYARNNGGQDAGAFCRDLAKEFRDGPGLPPATMWADNQIYAPRGGFPQSVLDAAAEWQALEIYQCLSWEHVCSALTRRFVVYHGFVMGNRFQQTGKDGKVPEWDGSFSSGHAMFSRGLTRRFGDWRTITPNSWGKGFGDNGIGYWPKSYFWASRGNYVNLDCFAIRAVKRKDTNPQAS